MNNYLKNSMPELSNYGIDSQDITQQAFTKMFLRNHQFQSRSSVKTWLCSIARNEAKIELKKKSNKNSSLDLILETNGDSIMYELQENNYYDDQENMNRVRCAVSDLGKKNLNQATTFILRYMQGLTIKVVALMTDSNISTVKTRSHRAMNYVRRIIGQY